MIGGRSRRLRAVGVLTLAVVLLSSSAATPTTRAAAGWTASAGTPSHVDPGIVGASVGLDATLTLTNKTDITPFGSPAAALILDLLGFGGGYSQEATWSAPADPAADCSPLDLPSICRASSRKLLLPGSLQGFLGLHATSSGATTILVAPDETSLAYDVSVAAIGMALEALTGGPALRPSELDVATLALQLSPEAAGAVTALLHGDATGAFNELVALAKVAAQAIISNAATWAADVGLRIAIDILPGALEVELSISAAQAIVVLAHLDVTLMSGDAGTSVSIEYQAGPDGVTTATPPSTPSLSPAPTPTSTPKPTRPSAPTHVTGSAEPTYFKNQADPRWGQCRDPNANGLCWTVSLRWHDASTNESGFRIYVQGCSPAGIGPQPSDLCSGSYQLIKALPADSTSATLNVVTSGDRFLVAAYNSIGESKRVKGYDLLFGY